MTTKFNNRIRTLKEIEVIFEGMKSSGKILYLVRHAKSAPLEGNLKDWQRPLLDIGIERANKISALLKGKKIYPDKIISSHALRALNTAVIFALNMHYPVNAIEISRDIYEKQPAALTELIKKQNDDLHSLMLFGHNPGFTDLYNLLSEENTDNLSTSAIACIRFETQNWNKIHLKKGSTVFLETGK